MKQIQHTCVLSGERRGGLAKGVAAAVSGEWGEAAACSLEDHVNTN